VCLLPGQRSIPGQRSKVNTRSEVKGQYPVRGQRSIPGQRSKVKGQGSRVKGQQLDKLIVPIETSGFQSGVGEGEGEEFESGVHFSRNLIG
jgi:hypothetical protein